MSFLLDTDICSAFLKGNTQVWSKFVQHSGRHHVSAITVGELYTWALRASAPAARLRGLDDLLESIQVLDVTRAVGRKFGELRSGLLDSGQPTPDLDLLIGATALVGDLTLVTHNAASFRIGASVKCLGCGACSPRPDRASKAPPSPGPSSSSTTTSGRRPRSAGATMASASPEANARQ